MSRNKCIHAVLAALMCASTTLMPAHRVRAASMVEYPLLLLAVLLLAAETFESRAQGADIIVTQLQTAAAGAEAAHLIGNTSGEVSRLSKTIGAAEALMGMARTCDGGCGDVRDTLQQIIGMAAFLKTSALGASGSCQPNGVVGPGEQCDPLAVPTGCVVGGITVTYCSDECLCQSSGVDGLVEAVRYPRVAASGTPTCADDGQPPPSPTGRLADRGEVSP